MSAREDIFECLMPWASRPAPGVAESANEMLDAFAAEVRAETLREAADFVVTETRAATGADGKSPVWDIANAHAAGIAGRIRRMAEGR